VRQVCSHAGLAATQQAETFRRTLEGVLEPPAHPGAPELSEDDILALLHDGAVALDEAMADLDDVALAGMARISADDERLQVDGPRSAAAEFERCFPGP
jgi:hypothetical protein